MILTTYDKDLYEKALKEDAREEGLESGILLAKYLFNDNRSKDLERASKDIEYQKKLLKEYGIEQNPINYLRYTKRRCCT